MKKWVAYCLGGLVLALFIVLLANRQPPSRHLDERITLRQRDQIPYGTSAAYYLLPAVFPGVDISFDTKYPGAWDGVESFGTNQAVILIADRFYADWEELDRLKRFVEKGNSVFIAASYFSADAVNFFNLTFQNVDNFADANEEDSLGLKLERALFSTDSLFTYPGIKRESFIREMVPARTTVLGTNRSGAVNFVKLSRGAGQFYIHTVPMAFSNYFVLHKQNSSYFRQVLSVMPQNIKALLWNEYYLVKEQNPSSQNETSWLATLFGYPAFKWGFITALLTLFLAALLGMRRKQRLIPPFIQPANDSLDFIKTLGRLYYDQQDHKNMAQKMSAFFLEYIRSRFKIPTHQLDEEFIQQLRAKSGYPEPEIKLIVTDIKQLPQRPAISEEHLARMHRQFELFYQNT